MQPIDWIIAAGINGAIIFFGVAQSRQTRSSVDWFLAAKGLPWWIVGLSMFATAVDSGDYVAVVGGAYRFGISNLTAWWLGLPIGWLLLAFVMLPPLYRSGMFTNAEYLEYRFGPVARVLSALIQLQYRTNVLGNIAYSLYLTFSVLTGWGPMTWCLVVLIAAAAGLYTAMGGLKSVAITDAIQSVFMLAAALVLWLVVWQAVGGWSGIENRLEATDPKLVEEVMHVGGRTADGAPAALVIFGWIAALSAYCIVNHSQAMRLLGARSEWDMQTAVILASVVTVIVMWFNITLGIMGRALMPEIGVGPEAAIDEVFPRLVQQYLGPGLVGLVVAGVLAGGISTYDSIGSALASVFTRDIYARFVVKNREDGHYVRVSRFVTIAVIALSFLYVPFLKVGMVLFIMRLSSVAVIPLFTVYLMGALTRVNRRSGTIGLVTGILFGISSLLGETFQWSLPFWWTNMWWAYPTSMIVTASAMVLATVATGWENRETLRGLVTMSDDAIAPATSLAATEGTWLERSRSEAIQLPAPDESMLSGPWYAHPLFWAVAFIGAIGFVNLVLLW